MKNKNKDKDKDKNSLMINISLVLVLIGGLIHLIGQLFFNKGDLNFINLISTIVLIIFAIYFVIILNNISTQKKNLSITAAILLFIYFVTSIFSGTFNLSSASPNKVLNFTGQSLSTAVEWSENNNIDLIQFYEYSDLVNEYKIIYQNIKPGTPVKDIDSIKISISEGANPEKEIMVPKMNDWDIDRVSKFINDNFLSNVRIQFIESDIKENTLINQSKSGNIKRNDELILIFSAGEEIKYSDVKMIDLVNKNKFDAELYLNKNHIKYEIKYDFSSNIKKGLISKQSVNPGTLINGKDTKIEITISKGPEIKIIDFKNMSMSDATDWIISKKLKIEFNDAYDDSVKENFVIKSNYKKNDVVEEGTLIKLTISKGNLVMKKFDNFNDFRDWAEKYSIPYEEKHEFSNNIPAGDIISYSYKDGETIKNNSSITVIISNGKKIGVPYLIGLSKNDAIKKLNSAGLNYNFVYSYSNSIEKGKISRQSISSGSSVGKGTTITLTISNGKRPAPPPQPKPPACVPKTYTVSRELNNIFSNVGNYDSVRNRLSSFFSRNYPGVKINILPKYETGKADGSYVDGLRPGSIIKSCNNTPYNIWIAK